MAWPSDVPEATVQRLSTYLRIIRRLERGGEMSASSSDIAHHANVKAAQVRKDLSYFGDFGRRGVGYDTAELRAHLTRILGVDRERRVVVVGAGNLGAALVGYPGFEPRGFRVVGLFDNNPAKIGHRQYGVEILSTAQLGDVVRETGVDIAIVAVPASSAQAVVDQLVEVGIRCILNLAPVHVVAPPPVVVRSVDTTSQLELLSFCLTDYS